MYIFIKNLDHRQNRQKCEGKFETCCMINNSVFNNHLY